MTISELVRFYQIRAFTPYSAFVIKCLPGRRTTADWWLDLGGTADDSLVAVNIRSLLELPATPYERVASLALVLTTASSFFFDYATQELYIHLAIDALPSPASFANGIAFGYTNEGFINIDDVEYFPLLKSIPSIAQQADLSNYDKPAFISGQAVHDNTGGAFDDIIDENIYGNDYSIFDLESIPDVFSYTRDDLTPLASLYVEDIGFTLSEMSLKIQDKRKSLNVDIHDEFFADGKPVPLIYGRVRGIKATVIDDSASAVQFRVGKELGQDKVLSFDGNDYISVADNALIKGFAAYTMTADVYHGRINPTYNSYIRKENCYILQIDSSGKLRPHVYIGSAYIIAESAAGAVKEGVWQRISMTYDGTTLKGYVDGVLVCSAAASGTSGSATNVLYLGSATGGDEGIRGGMRNVRIHSSALTGAQIMADATTNLVASWALNEQAGSTVVDSINALNGTITGATWGGYQMGVVECEGDFGWSAVTPISYDLATGIFTLSSTYCRSPGNGLGETDGTVLPCRVRNCIGVVNTSALDIIADLNHKRLGVAYNAANYDTTAWAAAAAVIAPIGIVFDAKKKLYEAIAMIQNGCNVGFRYDIAPTGLRTVLLDDWSRAVDHVISWMDIKDNLTLGVTSDSTLLAAIATVDYDHDWYDDAWLQYTDDSQFDAVLLAYRQTPTLPLQSYVLTEAHAIQRAAFALERFSTVPRIVNAILHGKEWYTVRIYDTIEIELRIPNRAYFGWWKAQVLSVNPDFDGLSNAISAVLIERVT